MRFGVIYPDFVKSGAFVLSEGVPDALIEKALTELDTYRLVPERLIVNSWHGLDYLLVFPKYVTEEGWRMLDGFKAAEGEVIGAEGFEPPTFWSQTRRASQTALCSV